MTNGANVKGLLIKQSWNFFFSRMTSAHERVCVSICMWVSVSLCVVVIRLWPSTLDAPRQYGGKGKGRGLIVIANEGSSVHLNVSEILSLCFGHSVYRSDFSARAISWQAETCPWRRPMVYTSANEVNNTVSQGGFWHDMLYQNTICFVFLRERWCTQGSVLKNAFNLAFNTQCYNCIHFVDKLQEMSLKKKKCNKGNIKRKIPETFLFDEIIQKTHSYRHYNILL